MKDLERVQKIAVKIIYGSKFTYKRNILSAKFANNCLKNDKIKKMFTKHTKNHKMKLRNTETFKITLAKTKRLKNSAIPYMQRILNKEKKHQTKLLVS